MISGYNLSMTQLSAYPSIDYLMVGHLTRDLLDDGEILGGTAVYSALTAQALGLQPGIVTSWGEDLPLGRLAEIPIVNIHSAETTTFKNMNLAHSRKQMILRVASRLEFSHIPEMWCNAKIIHLGPVANEFDISLISKFSSGLIGITPQGWLRKWDQQGHVERIDHIFDTNNLKKSGAVVVSIDDVNGDESWIEELATICRVLAVTEGSQGVRVYWHGDVRRFNPPQSQEIDTTGAGDIFATAFFSRLYTTRDPWEAARFANRLASISVTRSNLEGIPTRSEIQETMLEIFE